ncbi:MAG: hypothetical protein IIW10_06975, partial [Spirochaetaceae bacterium]|nr:hypothetical protein [Spirochaetaceae bacterium]
IYGTVPIAHATGGLKKIINEETGFLYTDSLENAINRILERYPNPREDLHEIRINALEHIKKNYLWLDVIKNKYLPLYFS